MNASFYYFLKCECEILLATLREMLVVNEGEERSAGGDNEADHLVN